MAPAARALPITVRSWSGSEGPERGFCVGSAAGFRRRPGVLSAARCRGVKRGDGVRVGGWRGLPGAVRLVLAGGLVSAVGSGATVPYLFVFLQQGRGLGTGLAGALLTVRAVGALVGSVPGGAWADRLGVHRASLLALAAAAVSTAGLLAVRGPVVGVLVLGVYGVVGSVLGTALKALLGQITPETLRQRTFGISYALGNVGGAGGALLAAVVLGAWPGSGYGVLYGVDAASFLVLAVVVWRWVPARTADPAPVRATLEVTREPVGGYREVLGDGAMRWLCVLTAAMVAAGYCQLHVGLPATAAARHLPAAGLGWVFAANTTAVIVLQALLQRASRTWRRSTCLIVGSLVMAAAWLLVAAAPGAGMWGLAAAAAVFAGGEVLLAPVLGVLVNALAPAALRGRYNGAHTLAWTGGWLAGTALTGLLLAAHQGGLLFPAFVLLLVLAAATGIRVRVWLPATVDLPLAPPLDRSSAAPEPTPVG
jgi:MFS family permease